jgi:hypothetical protein
MADYDTLLETWGSTGSKYPSGYSYIEGEQPVDDWDNFFAYNTVEDIDHLIALTNDRVESGSGTSFPTTPETSHAFYRSDDERLYTWNSTQQEWNGVLKSDGDTLQGDLDLGGHVLKGIGDLPLDGKLDTSGNDIRDTASGKLIYDSTAGVIPLNALEQSDVTINTGSHISGGGQISLGGSLSVEVNDDFLLNTGDRVTGELVSERSSSSRMFTASDSSTGDKLSIRSTSSGTFELVGYDSSDGAWDYNSSLSYDPGNARWTFGSLPSINGNNVATQTWVNSNADADTVDGFQADELAKRNVGVEHDVYASTGDVPTSISKGEVVLIDGDGLYVEK